MILNYSKLLINMVVSQIKKIDDILIVSKA